jgi:peptide/nickel transport system permease protein
MTRSGRLVVYVGRRVLLSLPTLLLVAIFAFALMRMLPGDPAQIMLGDVADPATLVAMRHHLGLDRSVPLQFLTWIGHALQGDLGRSIATGEAVLTLIRDRVEVTASIVLSAVAIATVLAIVGGLFAASRAGRPVDALIVAASSMGQATPGFWLGLLLLLVFGVHLRWLPIVGYVPLRENFAVGLTYLVLPVATLVIVESGALVRTLRASAIEVLGREYIMHARAKGVREGRVLYGHVLPNAFTPTLTLVGLTLGHLLGGAAVIETVFTLPGLGRLIVDSILARDYPVVQGCLLFTAVIYVMVNLITDLLYPLFDPRVTAA